MEIEIEIERVFKRLSTLIMIRRKVNIIFTKLKSKANETLTFCENYSSLSEQEPDISS